VPADAGCAALRISAIAPAATYSTIIKPDDPSASSARNALPPLVSGSLSILIRECVIGAVSASARVMPSSSRDNDAW
jgi:hypothetical protein